MISRGVISREMRLTGVHLPSVPKFWDGPLQNEYLRAQFALFNLGRGNDRIPSFLKIPPNFKREWDNFKKTE